MVAKGHPPQGFPRLGNRQLRCSRGARGRGEVDAGDSSGPKQHGQQRVTDLGASAKGPGNVAKTPRASASRTPWSLRAARTHTPEMIS